MFFNSFCKIGLSKLTSIFDSIFVPICLHFPSKNQSKLHQNWNLEGIDILIDFCIEFFIDFPSIWDANLELCWPLRCAQDASKTPPRRLQDGSQDEVRDIFRSSGDFLVDLTPSWRNLGSNWKDLGLRFGSFWCPCIHIFRSF